MFDVPPCSRPSRQVDVHLSSILYPLSSILYHCFYILAPSRGASACAARAPLREPALNPFYGAGVKTNVDGKIETSAQYLLISS